MGPAQRSAPSGSRTSEGLAQGAASRSVLGVRESAAVLGIQTTSLAVRALSAEPNLEILRLDATQDQGIAPVDEQPPRRRTA